MRVVDFTLSDTMQKKTALPKRGLKLAHLEATAEQNKEVEEARKLWSTQLEGERSCSMYVAVLCGSLCPLYSLSPCQSER